jgi:hypothetical protein
LAPLIARQQLGVGRGGLVPLTDGKQAVTPLLFNPHKLKADTILLLSLCASHNNIITKANLEEDNNFILFGAPSKNVLILNLEMNNQYRIIYNIRMYDI